MSYIEYTIYDKEDRIPVAVVYEVNGSWTVDNMFGPTQYFDLVGDRTPESVFADLKFYLESHFSDERCYMRRTA